MWLRSFLGKRSRTHRDGNSSPVSRAARCTYLRALRLEPLEQRTLLSVLAGNDDAEKLTAAFDVSAIDKGDAKSSSWIDQGDYYWADGRKVSLYRLLDEVVVGVKDGVNSSQVLQAIHSLDGPASGLEIETSLDRDVLRLSPRSGLIGDLNRVLTDLSQVSAVSWVAPGFINGESGGRQWLTDDVVVSLRPGVDPPSFFASGAFSDWHPLLGTADQFIATVSAGGGLGALDVANVLQSNAQVSWASPNFFSDFRTTALPNDLLFTSQWHLRNTGQNGAASGADANLPPAWDTTAGSNSVVIAVLDDGVQTTTHPDLAANIFVNTPGETSGDGIDNDNNGWVDDLNGWDYADSDNNPNPATQYDNHGTAVAGVAAAVGNNNLGVSGASWASKILPLKIAKNTTGSGADLSATRPLPQRCTMPPVALPTD